MSASPVVSKVKLCFAFEVPGRAITVQLNQDLVALLHNEARQSFRNPTCHGESGYLVGRIDGQDDVTITVEASSRADQEVALPNKLERWANLRQGRACVIGAYHIQEGDRLEAPEQHMGEFRKAFSGLHSVFLVIQPSSAIPIAGMFVGSPGCEPGELPDLRFLFDPYQLNQAEPSLSADVPAVPSVERPPNHFSPPATAVDVPALPEARKPKQKRRLWHFGMAAGVLVVIAGAYYVPALTFRSPEKAPVERTVTVFNAEAANAKKPDTPSLGMKVTIQPRGLQITWDDTTLASRTAVHGTLQIRDGQKFRDVPLTTFQIRHGNLLYVPQTDDVDLRLDLVTADMTRYTDYIKVVGSAMPQPPGGGFEEKRTVPAGTPEKSAGPPARAFTPPQMAVARPTQSPEFPAPPQIGAAPKGEASIVAPALANPSVQIPSPPLAEQQTPVTPSPIAAQPAVPAVPQPVKADPAKLTDPILLKKTAVRLPSDLRALAGNMVVVVRITVDEKGHVVEAEPKPEKIAFKSRVAAIVASAVRTWEFAPAEMNGKPVRSDFEVQVAIH